MKNNYQSESFLFEINTTPLIDVLLVLLAILMITIPAKFHLLSINIDGSKKNIVSNNAITNFEIEIFPNQKYLWQTQQINYSEVVFRLTNISKDNIQLKIKAHPQSKYQDVIHLVNKANELGIKKIGIYKN